MLFGHGKPDLSLQNIESNHLIWYNLIVEKPTKEAVAIYRQEFLQDIRLFTSQPKAKFEYLFILARIFVRAFWF